MPEKKDKPEIVKMRREMVRRSLDTIKLYNPWNKPFRIIWDSNNVFNVNPKEEMTVPRYIAQRWLKKYAEHRITIDEQEAVDKENAKREKSGQPSLTPEQRETFVYQNKLLTSNEDLLMKYMKQAYKGVDTFYGVDIDEVKVEKVEKRPIDETMFEKLEGDTDYPMPEEHEASPEEIETRKESLKKEFSDAQSS